MDEQAMVARWEAHLAAEFQARSATAAVDTMVEHPHVDHVPVMTGGAGRKQLTHFYARYVIPQMPPDTTIVPSRPTSS